jgi:hypothetical protein
VTKEFRKSVLVSGLCVPCRTDYFRKRLDLTLRMLAGAICPSCKGHWKEVPVVSEEKGKDYLPSDLSNWEA